MLAETVPATVVIGWLGAALLVATAVPVARVFVLGPGSGVRTALAWPIVAFAPAVVGFALLGLGLPYPAGPAPRQGVRCRHCGAWAAVIISVAVLRQIGSRPVARADHGGRVSLGMVVGAAAGWLLLRRSVMPRRRALARPMLGRACGRRASRAGIAAAGPTAPQRRRHSGGGARGMRRGVGAVS